MAKFLHHESCPKCNSKDNKAVYSDGSTWCFGCRTYTSPKHREIQIDTPITKPPKDLVRALPFLYQKWLDKYELTPEEKTLFNWSTSFKRMVVKIETKDGNLFWEARSLTHPPKVLSYGKKPLIYIENGHIVEQTNSKSIILVEDILSAIKVSHYCTAMPLFGASIENKKLYEILREFDHTHIWLDADKYQISLSMANKISVMGACATSILTKEDPKECKNMLDILKKRCIIH